jgi:sulfonate transport system permease protein
MADSSRTSRRRFVGLAVPLAILTLWELLALVGIIDAAFFPPPSRIGLTAAELTGTGELPGELGRTTLRVVLGFAIGGTVGYALGIITGVFLVARQLLEPTLSAIYTVPKLALLPIFITVFGFGEAPKIALVSVTVFFYVWVYTMEAVVRIPTGYLDAARSFRADRRQVFRHVLLPASLPSVFTGLRVAIAVAVLVTISAEFIIGDNGLGHLIFNSRALFRLEESFVGIVTVALLGYAMQRIVVAIGARVTPWSRTSGPTTHVQV